MTIQRRPRPQLRRRLFAVLLTVAILWLVTATAKSPSARSALDELGKRGDMALHILRRQLADGRDPTGLPAAVTMAIGQSPVLLSGREAVLELRSQEESDDSGQTPVDTGRPQRPSGTLPLPEEPTEPLPPLLFADNGVPAKTLVPTSQKGYVVAGGVYISNLSDKIFDASLFDGTFDAKLSPDGPQVLIVHTHGSEAYTMPEGQSYVPSSDCRTTDCAYNTVRVGAEIAKVLEEAGIEVLHDPTLHDYPEYSGAYNRSLETVERYLKEYPTISFVLDVHRDAVSDSAGNPYKVVSSVAGLQAAQMSFVIGTDGGGLKHPRWQENLKLAAAVQGKLLDTSPTLMRPITVRNSRYNQHTTTGSLLVEMGAAGNSLDEALLSARLLGQALVDTIS